MAEDHCLDPQTLAAFVDRALKRSELPPVLEHIEHCRTCMDAVKTANEVRREMTSPRPVSYRWLAAAAVVMAIAGAAPFVWRTLQVAGTDRLVSLVPRDAREVEPRLTGGFPWAPYRGPRRSAGAGDEPQKMKLIGAAGEMVERADANPTPDAERAAGLGLVLVDRPGDAIARLRKAAESAPNDARAWSDLAAAEYAAALRLGRASLYPQALAHADRALRADANLSEALFNRGLILERLGLTIQAREAWDRYLRSDPSSPWAEEARHHLQQLPQSTSDLMFRRDQPRLESAAARGDLATVAELVGRYPQQCRTWAEVEYLGRWGEALQRGDESAAARELAIARAIGEVLQRTSGESLLHDACAAIETAPAQLARAHVAYRRGRMTLARRATAEAEPDLRDAAALFAKAHSPMALVARYYAATARYELNDLAAARAELEKLRAEGAATPSYLAHAAQVRWELALCSMMDEDWTAASALVSEGADRFRRLGETSNLAFMQGLLATASINLGKADEGWALRAQSFAAQSAEGRGDRLAINVADAARGELRLGRLESARALLNIEEASHRAAGDEVQISNALVRESIIDATVGDAAGADQTAGDALVSAERVRDAGLRARAVADAKFAAGSAALQRNPAAARASLSEAIAHYRATEKTFYLPEALLLRGRASMRLGARGEALRDFEEGLAAADRHQPGTGVLDARRALFEEIVTLKLDGHDVGGAFSAAERTSIAALQQKLAGSDTAVLELLVLSRELVAFCVTANDASVARHPLGVLPRNDDRALFDVLIRPSLPAIGASRRLIVVPDAALRDVAFAALLDARTNRYLVQTMSVAIAPGAASLERGPPADVHTLVAVALPAGETNATVALAEEKSELADVTRLYRDAVTIDSDRASLDAVAAAAPRASVIHIAGHTQSGALLFAGGEAATSSRLAALKLAHPVVVLAACDTLPLGGGLLSAGATDVIGTLEPVADNEARDFFRAVHRELSSGRDAAEALRRAQIEAIDADPLARRSVWRAVALLTRRIDS